MILLIFITISSALTMLNPYYQELRSGEIILINSYPNIPIILEFNPKENGESYDIYTLDLPNDWITNPPSRFQNPIRIIITPSDNSLGEYIIPITFIDEYEINPLPNKTIFLNINISRDLFNITVDKNIKGNYKQPVRFKINIKTKAPATYIISAKSYNNRFFREVYVKDIIEQQIEFIYPFEGKYDIELEVKPKYSKSLSYKTNLTAEIKEDIFRDFEAYRYGALLFFQQNSITASFINLIYQFLNR